MEESLFPLDIVLESATVCKSRWLQAATNRLLKKRQGGGVQVREGAKLISSDRLYPPPLFRSTSNNIFFGGRSKKRESPQR